VENGKIGLNAEGISAAIQLKPLDQNCCDFLVDFPNWRLVVRWDLVKLQIDGTLHGDAARRNLPDCCQLIGAALNRIYLLSNPLKIGLPAAVHAANRANIKGFQDITVLTDGL